MIEVMMISNRTASWAKGEVRAYLSSGGASRQAGVRVLGDIFVGLLGSSVGQLRSLVGDVLDNK